MLGLALSGQLVYVNIQYEQSNPLDHAFSVDLLLPGGSAARGRKALHLTQDLRAAILSGRLPVGVRLPPSRTLAAELAVSRSVVVRAYTDLIADGYLEARQGAGTRQRPCGS